MPIEYGQVLAVLDAQLGFVVKCTVAILFGSFNNQD